MKKKKSLKLINIIFIGIAIILFDIWFFSFIKFVETNKLEQKQTNTTTNEINLNKTDIQENKEKEELSEKNDDNERNIYEERKVIKNISEFDLSFLKLENKKVNKIYSPLSIKYALKMLEEGASNVSRWKITRTMGNSALTKYTSNNNMTFANAFFVKDSYKKNISDKYIEDLKNEHDAKVIFDSFETPDNINSWVSDKTFKLIDNLVNEQNLNSDFLLINALAIDMEWRNKFLSPIYESVSYDHENFSWSAPISLSPLTFGEENMEVSSMEILASINNYDIVSILGEENIKNTVYKAFIEYCNKSPDASRFFKEEDLAPEKREETFNKFFYGGYEKHYSEYDNQKYVYYDAGYISELNSNYGNVAFNTDFSLYVDDKIKVFAKDLKEYDGTTLQYIGIMPRVEDLDSYIQNINDDEINNIVNNLKDLRTANFKEGVVTRIIGNIPKFKFEYDLDLKGDFKKIGLGHIFEQENAGLTFISEIDKVYIQDAIHKAVIEFTQDGIKAAASTQYGGGGGGEGFDYIYEIPIEEIDLTFDKPYMFLIRDKETGELWFTGTVYEPLQWSEEDPSYTYLYSN